MRFINYKNLSYFVGYSDRMKIYNFLDFHLIEIPEIQSNFNLCNFLIQFYLDSFLLKKW